MYDDALMEFLKLETRLAYFFANNKETIPIVLHTYSETKYGIYMTTGSVKLWDEPTHEKMVGLGKALFQSGQGLVTAAFLTGHVAADTKDGVSEYITVTGMTVDKRKVMAFFDVTRENGKLILNKTVNFSYKPSTLERMGSIAPLEALFEGYLDNYHIEK